VSSEFMVFKLIKWCFKIKKTFNISNMWLLCKKSSKDGLKENVMTYELFAWILKF